MQISVEEGSTCTVKYGNVTLKYSSHSNKFLSPESYQKELEEIELNKSIKQTKEIHEEKSSRAMKQEANPVKIV